MKEDPHILNKMIAERKKARGLRKIWWYFEIWAYKIREGHQAVIKAQDQKRVDKILDDIENE